MLDNMRTVGLLTFLFLLKTILAVNLAGELECALLLNNQFASTSNGDLLSKPVEDNVFFYIHTTKYPNETEIKLTNQSIQKSDFNSSRSTKIVTHGYLSNKDEESCVNIRNALLATEDVNVIVIDWSKMSIALYDNVVEIVPTVANYVAKMIEFLVTHQLNLTKTTLIGHSLGAHVMGIAGSKLKKQVGYIVGLDPAGPRYDDKPESERLSPDDAVRVHVLHTNAGYCGINRTIGDYDFLANGGEKQPGCDELLSTNRCAHARSHELYAESIYNKRPFKAIFCINWEEGVQNKCGGPEIIMAPILNTTQKFGTYYVKTNSKSPFAPGRTSSTERFNNHSKYVEFCLRGLCLYLKQK